MLLHELAHVKRCDVSLQMIARAAFALYWFHPLAWWGIRRMRLEREHACDDCVLLAGQKASSYAAQLLEIARAHRAASPLSTAALSMARPSQLEGRLLAVLDAHRSRVPLSAARGAALALVALLLVIGLGILRPTVQADAPTSSATIVAASNNSSATASGSAAAAADQLTVTGTVLSPKGQPVAGALVEIVAMHYRDNFYQPYEDPEIPYHSASTDAAGRFAIALPRDVFQRAQVMAFTSAEGFACQQLWLFPKPHQRNLDVSLALLEPRTVRLQFMDTAGSPVAGIEPQAWYLDWRKRGSVYLGDHRAARLLKSWPKCSRTDNEGMCSVVIPAAMEDVLMIVESERYGRQTVGFKPSDDPIVVALKPGRYLNGQVIAADTGAPIEGAEVFLWEKYNHGTRTDKNGRFRIATNAAASSFSPAETIIKVFPPASSPYLFYSETWKWSNDIVGDAQLTIKMRKGIVVEGDLLENGAGKPVAGASVYYMPQQYSNEFFRESEGGVYQWPFDWIYQADEKGHFRIPVSPGPGYVFVKAPTPDYVHVMVSAGESYFGKPGLDRNYYDGALHLNLKPDDRPQPVRIELQRGVTLRRQVVRPDGQAADGLAYFRTDMFRFKIGLRHAAAFVENGVLEVPGFEPDHSNPLFLVDLEHHCGATVSPTASDVRFAKPTDPIAAMCVGQLSIS